MLVSEVLNSRAIALAASNAASNTIPYLGLQWFPEQKKAGLDLKWIKTHRGLPVTLKPSNFDAIPVLRARDGLKTEATQMAFFRESMQISEHDRQEIARVSEANDPYLLAAVRAIYDDTNRLVAGAEVVPEIMRMQLLTGQDIVLSSDGVNYTYDYDATGAWAATNYTTLSGTSMWNDTTHATPIDDINTARKALARAGHVARYIVMNSNTFAYLAQNTQVRNNLLALNVTAVIAPTDADVMNVIRNRTGLEVVLYDKMYTDYTGTDQYFYPDGYATLLPAGAVGSTWFGTTPEEITAIQVADVDVTMYGTGIAIAVKDEYGPPAKTVTTAAEVVLPSFEGMDGVAVIKAITAGSTGDTGSTGETGETGGTGN